MFSHYWRPMRLFRYQTALDYGIMLIEARAAAHIVMAYIVLALDYAVILIMAPRLVDIWPIHS